jgi:class 3 adenylate cyclase/energy-coupling factor transporter ATP-binding protein EcfA2
MPRRSQRPSPDPSPEQLEEAGRFLREVRRRRNLTQSAVARRASYTNHQTVLNWEMGQLPWRNRSRVLWLIRAYRLYRTEADHILHLTGYDNSLTDAEWGQYGDPPEEGVQPMPVLIFSDRQPAGTSEGRPEQSLEVLEEQSAPVGLAAPEAEHRQVTVLLAELVDFGILSQQLDPSQLNVLVQHYQGSFSQILHHFGGNLEEQREGILLAYFGYPVAHEDDAQRAVYAGLSLIEIMRQLSQQLDPDLRLSLAVRITLHTDLSLLNWTRENVARAKMILGESRKVAATLQAFTEPNGMVISETTHQLVEGLFVCRALELPAPISSFLRMGYQVLQESLARSRIEAAITSGRLTPLVGRELELQTLHRCWTLAQQEAGQVVLLIGAPGVGKSRLVRALQEELDSQTYVFVEGRCSELHQQSALYLVIDLLQCFFEFRETDTAGAKLAKLQEALNQYHLTQENAIPLFASLLSLPQPDEHSLLDLTPEQRRRQTLTAILSLLLNLAAQQPVLFILEDLHWADPSTLEFLQMVMDQVPTAPVLLLLTFRPEFQPPAWAYRGYVTPIVLKPLSSDEEGLMIQHLSSGHPLPAAVYRQLLARTDGIPLYIEELTRLVLEQEDHIQSLERLPIPAALRGGLTARLDRLPVAKRLAGVGATIGQSFSYELLQEVAETEETALQLALGQLVATELLYQRGIQPQATYIFKHALIREQAYELLPVRTKRKYHQRIAQVLEKRFPETVTIHPELLAHHYAEGGLKVQAISYWQKAGEQAITRSANLEAVSHITRGLELLQALPDTPEKSRQELALQATLGVPLLAIKGYTAPDVERAFARARELCQQVGQTAQLASVLWGLWAFYSVRSEFQASRRMGHDLLALAQEEQNNDLLLEAHTCQGFNFFWGGAHLTTSHCHFEQGLALYDPQQHHFHAFTYGQDPAVVCLSHLAWILWLQGYPEQALERNNQAMQMAIERGHTFSMGYALAFSSVFHQIRRENPSLPAGLLRTPLPLPSNMGFHSGWPMEK